MKLHVNQNSSVVDRYPKGVAFYWLQIESYHAVTENIHTNPMKGHWKFEGGWGGNGRGILKAKFIKESTKLNWKFQGEGRVQTKKTFQVGGMDISWNHTKHVLYNAQK